VIIPSIDLMGAVAVQLIGGRDKAIDAGDPLPIARRFALAGEIAVIDLDAALGRGENRQLIRALLRAAPCRVGGGIRDLRSAVEWLDAGAARIILGTAAEPGLLARLPRERLIAALDADHGEVVVEGWRTGTGRGVVERMRELRPYVGGFLVTFVEREGRMGGVDLAQVEALVSEAGDARLTVAGGVTTAEEIAAIDRLGADAQVGMALYTGRLSLADAIAAPLVADRPDGLWPTVVAGESGEALGLAWSSRASLRQAVETRQGVYHSRKRGIWTKGESSGAVQDLLRIDLDCDRDALRFTVCQHGEGFCHRKTATCWGGTTGLVALASRLRGRIETQESGSYTARLMQNPELLRAKLREEAGELASASTREETISEAADLLYFALVRLLSAGATLADVEKELDARALRLSRRPGDAKPGGSA
jgi:phosphoribosyl-ATP pyrophosphohydrolase/phosphoribosyl-AMP cyclohydrolase